MSSSPLTSDFEMESPVPVPASPSTAQSRIAADCGHLSNSPTPSSTIFPFPSIELCRPCKHREGISLASHLWNCAQSGMPFDKLAVGHCHTWRHTRLALANYRFQEDGTDGCSEEDDDEPRWSERARLEAANLDPDVLTKKEVQEIEDERKEAAAKDKKKKKRKSARVVAEEDDEGEATFEGQMSTPHVNSPAYLPTPEQTENIDKALQTTTTLSTPVIRSKPLISVLKTSTTKTATGTTESASFDLNADFVSISSAHLPTTHSLRRVTFHPAADVQDDPIPLSYPHRAETEYRNDACYDPRTAAYEPGQWAEQTPASDLASDDTVPRNKGKKRQRENEDDGDEEGNDSGDWKFKGTVLTTEEVDRLGGGMRLRSWRRS
jgi:hypothetical protein